MDLVGRLFFRALPVLGLLVLSYACSDLSDLSTQPNQLADGGKAGKDSGRSDAEGPGEDAGPTPEGARCDKTKPFEAPTLTEFDPTSIAAMGTDMAPLDPGNDLTPGAMAGDAG